MTVPKYKPVDVEMFHWIIETVTCWLCKNVNHLKHDGIKNKGLYQVTAIFLEEDIKLCTRVHD